MQPGGSTPILTVVVPLNNRQGQVTRCLDSLTDSRESVPDRDLEILVIDDGSIETDSLLANDYAMRRNSLLILCKTDEDHNSSIDFAMNRATGTYMFVLESYDEVVPSTLRKVTALLRWLEDHGIALDVLVLDRILHDERNGRDYPRTFGTALPVERTFSWDETSRSLQTASLAKASLVFRRSLIIRPGLHLPARIFHVGSLYAFLPLAYSKLLYHLAEPLNIHHIDRTAPSDSYDEALLRTEDRLRVTRYLVSAFEHFPQGIPHLLESYLERTLAAFLSTTLGTLTLSARDDRERKKVELIQWIHRNHPITHRKISSRMPVRIARIGGGIGKAIASAIYRHFDARHRFE
jgi:glycosyltransferase involved in cell wall biosynthesis